MLTLTLPLFVAEELLKALGEHLEQPPHFQGTLGDLVNAFSTHVKSAPRPPEVAAEPAAAAPASTGTAPPAAPPAQATAPPVTQGAAPASPAAPITIPTPTGPVTTGAAGAAPASN